MFITRILSYKILNRSDDTVAERHHNSTGNLLGVITRLELLIKVLQIFFSF
jgi:hypothetical protein